MYKFSSYPLVYNKPYLFIAKCYSFPEWLFMLNNLFNFSVLKSKSNAKIVPYIDPVTIKILLIINIIYF